MVTLLLSILLLNATSAAATTLVILVTRDRIVVAADSKQTRAKISPSITGGPIVTPEADATVCKIQVRGNSAFVASGTVEWAAGDREFSVHTAATSILEIDLGIVRKYRLLFDEVVTAVPPPAERVEPLKAGFLAWEDGRPHYLIGQFDRRVCGYAATCGVASIVAAPILSTITRTQFDQVSLDDCLHAGCRFVEVLGKSDAIDRSAIENALVDRPSEKAMIALAEAAVQRQIIASPALVGGDIDIAVIDKKGARWVRVKAECQEKTKK